MALLSNALKDKEFDIRMVQRSLSKGHILQTEVDKHHSQLPDESELAQYVSLETFADGTGNKTGLRD